MKESSKKTAQPKVQPSVTVVAADETLELRLWARRYVHLLCSIEGVASIPSTMERAS
jgi:hypothetical protein